MISLLNFIKLRCEGKKANFARIMEITPQHLTTWVNRGRFISEDGYLCIRYQKIPDFETFGMKEHLLLLESIEVEGNIYPLALTNKDALSIYSENADSEAEVTVTVSKGSKKIETIAGTIQARGGVFTGKLTEIKECLNEVLWEVS